MKNVFLCVLLLFASSCFALERPSNDGAVDLDQYIFEPDHATLLQPGGGADDIVISGADDIVISGAELITKSDNCFVFQSVNPVQKPYKRMAVFEVGWRVKTI